ncbi:MAG TPA: hypothetical protein VK550_08205 [Polyangiaceae bacterium]|jgi:hypothetical protein|nr:hypothetical protein [Polyangiaceae bacterium]
MAQLTFRDFAGAIMEGNSKRAAEVLEQLLGVDTVVATKAASHFQQHMTEDPAFMGKAMGLRTAVTGGTDEDIQTLLGQCFGLTGADQKAAVAALRQQYPA